MRLTRGVSQYAVGVCLLLGVVLMAGPVLAGPAEQRTLGPEDESKQITVTVWLNLHNKAALDARVQDMYDKSSPNYHHFLTREEYKAEFAPSADDAAKVSKFLAAHNMKVTTVDKLNHFVMAQGRVSDVQAAFNTQINRVMVKGEIHRAAAAAPTITDEAAPLVATVQGLSDLGYRANTELAANPETGEPYAGVSPSAVGSDGLFFSGQCLRPPEEVTFTTGGDFPKATYFGNRYGQNITNGVPNLPPCGYDSAELQQAYGLNPLYNQGLDGTGQTIMIVDGFGSNTILTDANLFSSLNGLPQLTTTGKNPNFTIFTPLGPVTCTAANGCIAQNGGLETTLDVEWAHSIAPGANIALILSPDLSFTNIDLANLYAIENGFGNVLSNSFGIPEIVLVDLDPPELVVENGLSEIAAALGISQNVASGDFGDSLAVDNADFGINATSPGANSDSPFATGVGGTSTFLDSHSNIFLQTGWGLNETRIANPSPNPPTVPPLGFGFLEGATGGESTVYAKPSFQKHVKGNFRQTPDIAMNADPETGVEIVVTPTSVVGDPQTVLVAGGTSLSCPMFSALWAIANQAAGGGPIGQAAPILYQLSEGRSSHDAIFDVDVKPTDTFLNVTGFIFNPPTAPVTFESASALAQPLENTKYFISALFQSATSTRWDVFTFGTDSSLTTGPGWDNVTGLGTPQGLQFIEGVVNELK